MSNIETILTRAMSDVAFADLLFANPEQALSGYAVTSEELASIKSMTRADFGKLAAASPEERVSLAYQAHMSIKGTKQGPSKGELPPP